MQDRRYGKIWVVNKSGKVLSLILEPSGMELPMPQGAEYEVIAENLGDYDSIAIVYHGEDSVSLYTSSAESIWVIENQELVYATTDKPVPLLS